MSIIIEGMKMPIDGKQFVVTVENGTWIFQECCKPAKIFTVSEIPSHGRLIDADALCDGLVSNHPVIIHAKNAPTIIPATNKE